MWKSLLGKYQFVEPDLALWGYSVESPNSHDLRNLDLGDKYGDAARICGSRPYSG
jgi:hypothetical protein